MRDMQSKRGPGLWFDWCRASRKLRSILPPGHISIGNVDQDQVIDSSWLGQPRHSVLKVIAQVDSQPTPLETFGEALCMRLIGVE